MFDLSCLQQLHVIDKAPSGELKELKDEIKILSKKSEAEANNGEDAKL